MAHEIREKVTVGPGGLIEIRCSELPEGAIADVTVVVQDVQRPKGSRKLSRFFGSVKGCFKTAEEADAFLRGERDSWDR